MSKMKLLKETFFAPTNTLQLLVIWTGICAFEYFVDKRLSRIEKKVDEANIKADELRYFEYERRFSK